MHQGLRKVQELRLQGLVTLRSSAGHLGLGWNPKLMVSPHKDLVAVLFRVRVNAAVMFAGHQIFSAHASESLTC